MVAVVTVWWFNIMDSIDILPYSIQFIPYSANNPHTGPFKGENMSVLCVFLASVVPK